jgi:hypothetical protein
VKKFALSALAVAAFAGAANADINFRIVAIESNATASSQAALANTQVGGFNTFGSSLFINNRNTTQSILTSQAAQRQAVGLGNTTGSAVIDASGGVGQQIIFVLQAQHVNVAGGLGFATVGGAISTTEAAANASMTRYRENAQNQEGFDFEEAPISYVNGHFRPYNTLANLGSPDDPNANGLVDASGGFWSVSLIQGLQTGTNPSNVAAGVWDNVYAFAYTNLSSEARVVTFNFSDVGQFSSVYNGINQEQGQPNPVDSGPIGGASFTLTIVPAPGAAALLGLGGLVAARRRRA